MGAAEWTTGYTSTAQSYSAYSSLPTVPPPASTSYGYDSTGMVDHTNFHIPTGM